MGQLGQHLRRNPELWMETMQDLKVEGQTRCLFVISHDFGELGFANSLLSGSRFAEHACVLLPEHLYELNQDSLPCPSRCYRNFDDIRMVSQTYEPDVVFLLSAYLFWPNKIASLTALKRWV